jgi:hypothetical protein
MNSTKYTKIILHENWANNNFAMIKEKVTCFYFSDFINFQMYHPKILSGEAFWITPVELCVGYYLRTNPDIFRPIFSHKRQRLLDMVHNGKEDDDEYSINNPHLGYARKKYLVGLDEKKKIPMDCIEIILSFIHEHLQILPQAK